MFSRLFSGDHMGRFVNISSASFGGLFLGYCLVFDCVYSVVGLVLLISGDPTELW